MSRSCIIAYRLIKHAIFYGDPDKNSPDKQMQTIRLSRSEI